MKYPSAGDGSAPNDATLSPPAPDGGEGRGGGGGHIWDVKRLLNETCCKNLHQAFPNQPE